MALDQWILGGQGEAGVIFQNLSQFMPLPKQWSHRFIHCYSASRRMVPVSDQMGYTAAASVKGGGIPQYSHSVYCGIEQDIKPLEAVV